MKSQDIFLLLKLVSLHQQEHNCRIDPETENEIPVNCEQQIHAEASEPYRPLNQPAPLAFSSRYSARGLESETGVSKSEVSLSLKRSIKVGLAKLDRKTNVPRVNVKALTEFIAYGIKYVFPAEVSQLSRGIPTSFAAPVLKGKIMSAGDSIFVWPDAKGSHKGQSVKPLYSTVTKAIQNDPWLYGYLALVDSIRLGNARETMVAVAELNKLLKIV